jgi:hypothetical protein
MHKGLRWVLAVMLSTSTVLLAAGAEAADSAAKEAGYGAGAVMSTLLYAPAKTTFCILGGVTSFFTLPFGGTDTAGKVATAACGGTWLITPDNLQGKERVRFLGDSRH